MCEQQRSCALQASVAKSCCDSCMPPKALSRFADRDTDWGLDWGTLSPTNVERWSESAYMTRRHTHESCGRAAVIAARRGTVCGEVGRVPRFPSSQPPYPLPLCSERRVRRPGRGRLPAAQRLCADGAQAGGTENKTSNQTRVKLCTLRTLSPECRGEAIRRAETRGLRAFSSRHHQTPRA